MSKEFDPMEWYGGMESSYADDAPEQVKCDSCNQYTDTDELDRSGNCYKCAGEIRSEEAIAFMTAPTLAGCLNLMGVR